MTRKYEAVYVFDSTLEDVAITDKLGRLHGLLGTPGDLEVNHWVTHRFSPCGEHQGSHAARVPPAGMREPAIP